MGAGCTKGPPMREVSEAGDNGTNDLPSFSTKSSKRVTKSDIGTTLSRPSNLSRTHSRKASTYSLVHAAALTKLYKPSGKSSRVPQGISGLPNYGNTCYFNTTVQSLLATPPLTDYFLGYDYTKEMNKDNVDGSKSAVVAKTFGTAMKNVWKDGGASGNPVTDIKSLHRAICSFHSAFSDFGQHDIAECLGFLLDAIHEDLNRVVGRKPYVEDVERVVEGKLTKEEDVMADEEVAAKAWEGYLRRNRSIIVDLFQGQLRSTLRCCNASKRGGEGCGREVRKFEPFMFLTLPVDQNGGNVQDAIQNFCSTEVMDGDNMWYCSNCKEHVRAKKKIEIWKVPPMLIVHLKRFSGRGGKINASVSFPMTDFDMAPFLKSPITTSTIYDCYSVALHHGSAGGGHYTSLGKSRITGNWYDLNDSHVGEVPPSKVENHRNAYVLFYSCMVDDGEEEEGRETEGSGKRHGSGRREVHIRRQSVSMPHLWPHMNKRDQPSLKGT